MPVVRLAAFFLAVMASPPSFADAPPPLLARMAGTWDVVQRMWTAPGSDPTPLPAAIAERRLVRDAYIEEVMQPATEGPDPAAKFTRHAFVNYNAASGAYEYSSLDTRAPQIMIERSQRTASGGGGEVRLQGGSFKAPEWGAAKNVSFTYRLTLGDVQDGKQTVRLFLTPTTVLPHKEFLAFEYLYSKRP